jgi:hypothetical protein
MSNHPKLEHLLVIASILCDLGFVVKFKKKLQRLIHLLAIRLRLLNAAGYSVIPKSLRHAVSERKVGRALKHCISSFRKPFSSLYFNDTASLHSKYCLVIAMLHLVVFCDLSHL